MEFSSEDIHEENSLAAVAFEAERKRVLHGDRFDGRGNNVNIIIYNMRHGAIRARLMGKLTIVERCIEAACRKQRCMISLLDDMSVFHDKDHIRALDRGQAMGHDKARPALHHRRKCILDLQFRACVDGARRLIEDQYRRQTQHDACDTQ